MKQNENITENMEAIGVVTQEEVYKSGIIQYIDSREVAEIVEKKHYNLVRDIGRYTKELTQLNFEFSDFFIESSYKDTSGKSNKCYLVTRKGCEFIAHKLTGIKGTKFTATYINRFHEMEERIQTASAEITEEVVEKIVENMVKRLSERTQMNHYENRDMEKFKGSNPYGSVNNNVIEIRKKELYAITMKVAILFGESHSEILHQMYKGLEQRLDIVLDAYKSVYHSETGRRNASMIEVIAANDRIYKVAIDMNEYIIGKKQIYN